MVKWGVLGTAAILDKNTARAMQAAENCELYAIAGRNPEKVDAFQQKYGFQKAYCHFDELLADPEVQAVYIPLPNAMHAEWTIRALNAGKHVLCEKPIAPSTADLEAMFAAAHANNVYLMEAFAYQHSPFIQALCDEIAAGTIGDVLYVEAQLVSSDSDVSDPRMRRETLGGAMYDLGVYPASFVQRIMGEEPQNVNALATFTDQQVDFHTTAYLEYANGARATIVCGMDLVREPWTAIDTFRIYGTKGSIEPVRFAFNAMGPLVYKIRTFDGSLKEKRVVETPNNYQLEIEQFGRAIEQGEAPAVTEAFSKANTRTVERILQAIGY
ncbi:MAG: Gfo/Idh/MocA family oxidoreductase [Coriobacteriia bacterium]|nr:Gfo/Idh/MocA family oxidoreductase [Coriobacteriia bacterium]